MFKVNNKNTITIWCLYCKLWVDFTNCSAVSFVDFEQINASWLEALFCWLYKTFCRFYGVNYVCSLMKQLFFSFVYSVSDERNRLRDLCEYLLGPVGSQTKRSKIWEAKIMARTYILFRIVDSQRKALTENMSVRIDRKYWSILAGIFRSTFLLPVNGSKNSILNSVFKLNLFFVITSYQNLWKYEIRKPAICFQSYFYLLLCSSTFCLDPHITCSTILVA